MTSEGIRWVYLETFEHFSCFEFHAKNATEVLTMLLKLFCFECFEFLLRVLDSCINFLVKAFDLGKLLVSAMLKFTQVLFTT